MNKSNIMLISSGIFVFMFLLTFATFWYQARRRADVTIADDVVLLAHIFDHINKTAKIISFEHQKNYIDFLNVKSFVGSEVGPINLAYPDKWEGPYLKDNPTIQEKYYQVVHTNQGYFIVPGPGVKLFNGKIIGTDIMLDKNANIKAMMQEGGVLNFNDRPLAVQIMDGQIPQLPKGDSPKDRMLRERLERM
jgi:hypothetical protein